MNYIQRVYNKIRSIVQPIDTLGGDVGRTNKLNRDQWLEKTLTAIPAGSRILDAGAGELQYRALCSHLDYVSQDFAQYDGSGDGAGLQTGEFDNSRLDIVSDIASIPEPDASFDAIMCIEVLEHVPHPVEALRELVRLLKPGGTLIVTAPFCSLTHYAPYFFQTGYSRYFYEHWLSELGCSIEEIDYNGSYFEYVAQELRRLPLMAKQYTPKHLNYSDNRKIAEVLTLLEELSSSDTQSQELLAYGLHILAMKTS